METGQLLDLMHFWLTQKGAKLAHRSSAFVRKLAYYRRTARLPGLLFKLHHRYNTPVATI